MSQEQPEAGRTPDRERIVPVGSRRRGPRMVPFLVTGAILGAIVGIIVDLTGPSSQVASAGQEVIVLGGAGALVGATLGAIVYLIAEWNSLRRL
ncbi:MAG: hypothetical protein WA903_01555 [Ornithinimicrobium sp.]